MEWVHNSYCQIFRFAALSMNNIDGCSSIKLQSEISENRFCTYFSFPSMRLMVITSFFYHNEPHTEFSPSQNILVFYRVYLLQHLYANCVLCILIQIQLSSLIRGFPIFISGMLSCSSYLPPYVRIYYLSHYQFLDSYEHTHLSPLGLSLSMP